MPMVTLLQIAKLVNGTLVGVSPEVAEKITLTNALPLSDAGVGCLTLLDHANKATALAESPAVAAIVSANDVEAILAECKTRSRILVAVDRPHTAFEQAIELIRPQLQEETSGIDVRADIADNAQLGRDISIGPWVSIGENCVIGDRTVLHPGVRIMANSVIGRDCEIFPNVVLYPNTVLEDRVVVHAGVVIGAYGFGYRQVEGRHLRTAQLGWVHLESDVEVGANTTIDRGTYGATRIATGTKIDNLVQIGHNVKVGQHNLICSQVGIAGSSSTGAYVVLGGQVGVRDHVHLGDRCMAGAQSGIAGDIPAGEVVIGAPAAPRKEALTSMMAIQRLPEMRKTLRQVQQDLQRLMESQAAQHLALAGETTDMQASAPTAIKAA